MTKEEKIKEAWGVYFEHLSEHATKHALENEGFCYVPACTLGLILRKYGEEWLETNKDLKNRPKSLKGIETNNGWIKIESEDDLPKDENIVEFWVYDDEEIVSAKFMYESKRWYHDVNLNLRLFPTHYQPIFKPKPPIY